MFFFRNFAKRLRSHSPEIKAGAWSRAFLIPGTGAKFFLAPHPGLFSCDFANDFLYFLYHVEWTLDHLFVHIDISVSIIVSSSKYLSKIVCTYLQGTYQRSIDCIEPLELQWWRSQQLQAYCKKNGGSSKPPFV